MKKAKKTWVLSTPKKVKITPSDLEKQLVEAKFKPIIEELKSKYIEKPHPEFNYRVDIYSKWNRNYFYLCSKYKSESQRAISKEFEMKFTRLEYKGKNSFDVAYMRHTEQWYVVFEEQTLDECLILVKDEGLFDP